MRKVKLFRDKNIYLLLKNNYYYDEFHLSGSRIINIISPKGYDAARIIIRGGEIWKLIQFHPEENKNWEVKEEID